MTARVFAHFLVPLTALALAPSAHGLSDEELERIGKKVWQNECGGTRDGLTSWNSGEDFGSFGIGHFIWYPKGKRGPFEESFPVLMDFMAEHGTKVPTWMQGDCPWGSRAEFQQDFRSERMNELRDLLAGSVKLQSRFLAERMRTSLKKMESAAPPADRENVRRQFERLARSGGGTYALIDYVNFKGEGTNKAERYQGEGWGLLQVLSAMQGEGSGAASEFGRAAAAVLERRVKNSPPARKESQWLPGWKNRVRGYGE